MLSLEPRQYPVIFVHGIKHNTSQAYDVRRWIEQGTGARVTLISQEGFRLRSVVAIQIRPYPLEASKRLIEELISHCERDERFVVVLHSFGTAVFFEAMDELIHSGRLPRRWSELATILGYGGIAVLPNHYGRSVQNFRAFGDNAAGYSCWLTHTLSPVYSPSFYTWGHWKNRVANSLEHEKKPYSGQLNISSWIGITQSFNCHTFQGDRSDPHSFEKSYLPHAIKMICSLRDTGTLGIGDEGASWMRQPAPILELEADALCRKRLASLQISLLPEELGILLSEEARLIGLALDQKRYSYLRIFQALGALENKWLSAMNQEINERRRINQALGTLANEVARTSEALGTLTNKIAQTSKEFDTFKKQGGCRTFLMRSGCCLLLICMGLLSQGAIFLGQDASADV